MTSPRPVPVRLPTTRYASLVWGIAVLAYVVAVLHRSALGVAGIEASARFGTGASVLATVVVVQLVVYAGLQVPVGVLLDRVGPRRLIAAGAALMALGQLALAVATTPELAVTARVLVGVGDACTFVSVIRLLPSWFSLRRVPLVTQLTGMLGQLGQVLAAVPLVVVLHGPGWTAAFGGAAVVGALAATAVVLVVRDSPDPEATGAAAWRYRTVERADRVHDLSLAALGGAPAHRGERPTSAPRGLLAATLREPGTWLGFWVHLVSGFSGTALVLLWASPFLLSAQGRTAAEVSALLTVHVLVALVVGPVVGHVSGRYPGRRLTLVVVVASAIGLAWAALLVPSRPLPLWALAVFMGVIAVGGPTSLVGLDIARSHNPRERLGTATGVTNAGAFVAALLTMLGIGLVLDARGGGSGVALPLADYRVALLCAAGTWVVGMVGLAVSARRVATRGAHTVPSASEAGTTGAGTPVTADASTALATSADQHDPRLVGASADR